MQRQIDLTNQANKVRRKHQELKALEELRDKHAAEGTYHVQTYVVNLEAAEGFLKRIEANQHKNDDLLAAKSDYNLVHNEFLDHFKEHQVSTSPNSLGAQILSTLFNLNPDVACVQELRNRTSLAREVAANAPKHDLTSHYNQWMVESIDYIRSK